MILCNNLDIEKDSTYSFLLGRLDSPKTKDLITVADKMLQLYDDIEVNEKENLPSEYFLLHQLSSELKERTQCIDRALDSIEDNDTLSCEEISVVDYGCGQGFASLSVLEWLAKNKGNVENIKSVKLIDKDPKALKRALLHFSILFPSVNVIAYEQDFLEEGFSVGCDSVLTLNLFSHVISDEFKMVDRMKDLILKGHNILMHNIIIEELSSKSYPDKLPTYYLNYVVNNIKDFTDCELLSEDQYTLRKRHSQDELIKLFKNIVLSRKDVLKLNIPKKDNDFRRLYPGEPSKSLINVPQNILWFERPLKNTNYCSNLDASNKISLEESHVSPLFEVKWKKEADIMNPHTIKECAEMFYQAHIHHALSCGLECGQKIVSLYEKAASDGITEAYNNLGILQFYDSDKEGAEEKGIELFKLAANGGSSLAMMNLASYYMTKGNEKEGIEYYTSASTIGNSVACYNLALIYDFGLYNQTIDKNKAEKLYRECLDCIKNEKELDNRDYSLQNNCCKNLILLLNNRDEHYLKLLDVYYYAVKPSDDLKYCREVLQILYTNRFSKDIMTTLLLSKNDNEKDFMKYNRAQFLYYGLNLKSFNVKIERDRDSAIEIMKSLVESENSNWEERERYVYSIYASWINSNCKGLGGQDVDYWRKASQTNKDHACAYLTNTAICGNIEDEEKKEIWKRFAFSDGCKSCHECFNYSHICPKAQLTWAKEYEKDPSISVRLLRLSAAQKYDKALFHLGFRMAITENIPSFKESFLFNFCNNFSLNTPPDEYKSLFPILSQDRYFYYLQGAADLRYNTAQSIMPYIAKLRSDKYNYIFWSGVFIARRHNEELTHSLLEFFETKTNKSLNNYFEPETVCEKQLLAVAGELAEHTDDASFLCLFANFYLMGDCLYEAQKYYNLAKEKGCTEIDDVLNDVNSRIDEIEAASHSNDYYDPDDYYDPYENYSWEDSLMDALDGEMDAYWNID